MIELCKLPYAYDALEPVISSQTMKLHHDKHHAGYVKKTNELATKAGLDDLSLEEIVRQAKSKGDKKLYNNAAQAWNHAFFWQSMIGEQASPTGQIASAISANFGDLAALKTKFVEEGVNHFGSGWVWLAQAGDAIKVISTHDADDFLSTSEAIPLLVCDLWEHAYYLDHFNDREAFLTKWFDSLANWQFAGEQMSAARQGQPGYMYPAMTAQHV
jgi:Fe-Mn family superoxide dismutase